MFNLLKFLVQPLYSAHEPELAYDNMGQAVLFLYLSPWNREP